MPSKHDIVSNRLAKKEGAKYNKGQGPDINTSRRAIEVESENTAKDGLRQLQGFRKPVYIAGSTPEATKKATEVTKGTTVGVMNQQGKVLKPSSRKRN